MSGTNIIYPPAGGGSSGGGGSNASVGPTGVLAPTSATEIGGINPSGNLQAFNTDASGNLLLSSANVNIAKWGGTPVTIGQTSSASSIPVVVASDQILNTEGIGVVVVGTPAGGLNADLIPSMDVSSYAVAYIQTGGTFSATLTVQYSNDNITFFTGLAGGISSISGPIGSPSLSSTPSLYRLYIGGKFLRIRATAYTSGSALGTLFLKTYDGASSLEGFASVVGNTSSGGNDSNNPVKIGGVFNTALPTVTNAQRVDMQSDANGRVIVTTSGTGLAASQSGAWTVSASQSGGWTVAASQSGAWTVSQRTPTAGTITQVAMTVGTTAVRATVSGAAPGAARSLLVVTADPNASTAALFYIGSSGVTSSGSSRGSIMVPGQSFIANNDAGDYYIVATPSSVVFVQEQV